MDTLIPTIAHAVRHPIHRDHELSLYIERPKAEKAVGFFGGVLIDLVDRAEHARVVQELSRERDELAAWKASVEQAEPVGMSSGTTEWSFESGQAIASFSVALPSPAYPAPPAGTKLYTRPSPAAAPERAEPVAPTCETRGLLGATSGVGRECDLWIGGACTSPEPCQHQQQTKPCRTCGPDGCSDSVACPKGGAA